MSTSDDDSPKSPDDSSTEVFFEDEDDQSEATKALMSNIYRLETDLDTEKDDRKEERFHWICACAILLDAIIIGAVDGSWLFVLLFMLQIIVLLGVAQRLGVDWAVKSLGWFLHWLSEKAKLK